ncbi:hypothetical protein IV203_035983 [Nitzschia inconspicua]|uniref:Uncharacterized protein n=1 Tax=Nitzschia inconspicua TaxID=303405 RepID=A0A9K3PXM6_9STRA|nr:hypothetical protein IV203_035983 [Nitzschia inconspicua]
MSPGETEDNLLLTVKGAPVASNAELLVPDDRASTLETKRTKKRVRFAIDSFPSMDYVEPAPRHCDRENTDQGANTANMNCGQRSISPNPTLNQEQTCTGDSSPCSNTHVDPDIHTSSENNDESEDFWDVANRMCTLNLSSATCRVQDTIKVQSICEHASFAMIEAAQSNWDIHGDKSKNEFASFTKELREGLAMFGKAITKHSLEFDQQCFGL